MSAGLLLPSSLRVGKGLRGAQVCPEPWPVSVIQPATEAACAEGNRQSSPVAALPGPWTGACRRTSFRIC